MPPVYESERLFSNSELRGHSEPGAGLGSQALQGPGAHFAYREEIKDLPWVRWVRELPPRRGQQRLSIQTIWPTNG